MIPEGLDRLTTLRHGGGSLELYYDAERRLVVAIAAGRIGPGLLRRELEVLRGSFEPARATAPDEPGRVDIPAEQQHTWSYVVDTTGVTLANPLNVIQLRQLGTLPGLTGYRVVATVAPIRWALRVLRHLVGADGVDQDLATAVGMLRTA